ncbi:MAG: type I DNA topoisomerase [Candidatus Omnitrophica bacterium]|nr:type I DNA topoisomerase [Candidatus Omnitrophota bacterium]
MAKYLVIVESPTKAKTIVSILGSDYDVVSSMGHIVDLPTNKLGVDIKNGFMPQYQIISGKEKIIKQIKSSAKGKEAIYIATDPDREGEAIGWHIKERIAPTNTHCWRVIFHEITEEALKEAFQNLTQLDQNLVNSQIARRVLDRLVGYSLSPLLWKKIVRGLSAGRVQSVALKFIVERERQINQFVPKKTFSIEATFKTKKNEIFKARIEKYKSNNAIFEKKEDVIKVLEEIKKQTFTVKSIIKREFKRPPPPPYTTSLLQQDAFNKLKFSSQKTMFIAQKLYEGVSLGSDMVGIITYMRTDSFYINEKAKKEAEDFIKNNFGADYLPTVEYKYKKQKGAQLAHEAIRPTSVYRKPENLQQFFTEQEFLLYKLIWERFIISRMREAIFENTKVLVFSDDCEFVAEGKRIIFDGFLKIFGEEKEEILPQLEENEVLTIQDLNITEHTTKPPPRFNDASIVRLMEEKGIGRPSTYAPTIQTLLLRNYIKRQKGAFVPTELGIKVNDLLTKYFSDITDENFTAMMEEKLDRVEEGKLDWRKVLEDFYPTFIEKLNCANELIKKEIEFSEKTCPKCGKPLIVKWSKKGKFLSCQGFPQCRYAESLSTQIDCPLCKEGKLVERKNKRGQIFYGCLRFPNCRYTTKDLPK